MSSSSFYNSSTDVNRRLWRKKSQLIDSTGRTYTAFTHDISMHGMSLFADKYYKPGQVCDVEIPMPAEAGIRNYRFNCRVVFSSLCGMRGFRTNLEFLDVPSEHKNLIQSVMSR
ncbi:PilZ domain-containing protein [Methylophilus sp. 3sh_L]|uniref:PilZ domain-containing protein n=1 Tax=Methylophilus sp. 3sh_L TaxID=3377114 RepID=UPI00398E5612